MGSHGTHVAIGSDELVRTGLFSRTVNAETPAKLEGIARRNPLRMAKWLKRKDWSVAERVGFGLCQALWIL